CPVVRLLRYGKGYIAVLCAPCRALNTNDIAAQYRQVISGRLLNHAFSTNNTSKPMLNSSAATSLRYTVSMFKQLFVAASCCLLSWPLAVNTLQVTDDIGKRVSLDQPAQRIVSLAPHVTELLFAAGAGDAVVGVVSYSDYPPEAALRPHVGDAEKLDVESIVRLQPDLVVAWESGNLTPQLDLLVKFGIPVFYSEPRYLEDIASNLERLGQLAGSDELATAAAEKFRARTRRLVERYSRATPVRVFYEIWHQPLMTVGGEHLISQLIRLCGGQNVFAELAALAAPVDREAVLMADPEVIIASGITEQRPPWLDQWLDWPQLSAVKHRHLYFIPPDLIQRHTPRVLEGAQRLCDQLEQARVSKN
ncbi:MAG: cobalamin-binding protein, partial [Pseudomonadota bacterium]|nr:cobalamin-binding protein [Pseudomonadota bacterium]